MRQVVCYSQQVLSLNMWNSLKYFIIIVFVFYYCLCCDVTPAVDHLSQPSMYNDDRPTPYATYLTVLFVDLAKLSVSHRYSRLTFLGSYMQD